MGYHMDLAQMSMDTCREKLLAAPLVPSRMPIKDNIEQHFASIKSCNIHSVAELLAACKTKQKLQIVADESGVPEAYLTLVNRELKSWLPAPEKISDLPGVPDKLVSSLTGLGFRNTVQVYERLLSPAGRSELAQSIACDVADVLRLARLTDLVRIRWVNHTFAGMLLACGYGSVTDVANADPAQLHTDIKRYNDEHQIFKGNIVLNDMKLCVLAAGDIPEDMEF